MMRLIPLPAFQDNYLWFLHDGRRARGVDPGDAQPVLAALRREGIALQAILVTHHHPGHVLGVDARRDAAGAKGWGRAHEMISGPKARPAQMEKLAARPGETRVCCTHEYTLSNLKFARAVEAGNLPRISYAKRCKELRAQGRPTLPSSIEAGTAGQPVPEDPRQRGRAGRPGARCRHRAG